MCRKSSGSLKAIWRKSIRMSLLCILHQSWGRMSTSRNDPIDLQQVSVYRVVPAMGTKMLYPYPYPGTKSGYSIFWTCTRTRTRTPGSRICCTRTHYVRQFLYPYLYPYPYKKWTCTRVQVRVQSLMYPYPYPGTAEKLHNFF
jgi:hypothetical protein